MADTSPIPTLLSFVVCDTVIHDAGTQKKTLVGLFDQIQSLAVPFVLNNIGLYAKLVEGSGPYTIRVRMVKLKDGSPDETPVMEMTVKTNWKNPADPMELGLNLRGIPIREFGSYEFQLFASDIYLGRAIIRATKLQVPPVIQAQGS